VFAERGSDASLEEIAACYARWVPGSWPEPKRRGVHVDAEIDDLVRLVNAIALALEDAPDRVALADRLFALMMDGGYAPASTRP
jgi:hypothetical protein